MSAGHIPISMQRRVRDRAGDRCEYCLLVQDRQEATFHVDHVVPRSAGGATEMGNLALACVSCSLRKGARLRVIDPQSGEATRVFHPRESLWRDHFLLTAAMQIVGRTAEGRATVEALKLNRPVAVAIRAEEHVRGRYPFLEG